MWPNHLNILNMCYNPTLQSSSGFTPHFLFFARCPTLPIDSNICSSTLTVSNNIDEYVKHQKDKLHACFDIALHYMSDTFLHRNGQHVKRGISSLTHDDTRIL